MTTASVSVEALSVGYGGVIAVDGVSFTVAAGEHVTLLGQSGCGKTTTLRAIAGLEHPGAGRITIDGATVFDRTQALDLPPERRGLAMVFQSYAIWPHMSVFDNVAFPLRVRGIARKAARPAVERALALVDLGGFAERPATKLSGGQQQRVALARAIAFETKVVLLDEPLSNLDAQLRLQMRTELGDLRRRLGFTSIYVTHDQEEAFALSDRIIVMRAGRIEQEGTPAEIYRQPRTRFVASFLGMRNILDAEIAAGDDHAEARLDDGVVLRARDPWADGQSGRAFVAFRPSHVRLDPNPKADGQGGRGTITRSIFLGDAVHSFLRSGGNEICAYHRPEPALGLGREVAWRVDPSDCLVLRA